MLLSVYDERQQLSTKALGQDHNKTILSPVTYCSKTASFFLVEEKVDIASRGKQENGPRHVTYSPRQQFTQNKREDKGNVRD